MESKKDYADTESYYSAESGRCSSVYFILPYLKHWHFFRSEKCISYLCSFLVCLYCNSVKSTKNFKIRKWVKTRALLANLMETERGQHFIDSETNSWDFNACFESVSLGQSLNEQNYCQSSSAPCRRWAVCLKWGAWDRSHKPCKMLILYWARHMTMTQVTQLPHVFMLWNVTVNICLCEGLKITG